jgi:hypothetical protein
MKSKKVSPREFSVKSKNVFLIVFGFGKMAENSKIEPIGYLFYVNYILKLDLREMLNFECKEDDCFIFIEHNNTRMPDDGIKYTEALEYLRQQHPSPNATIQPEVINYM